MEGDRDRLYGTVRGSRPVGTDVCRLKGKVRVGDIYPRGDRTYGVGVEGDLGRGYSGGEGLPKGVKEGVWVCLPVGKEGTLESVEDWGLPSLTG